MAIKRDMDLLDVETQIYLAEQSGQLSGPGYDIEALKAAGLVVPSTSSPIGVAPVSSLPRTTTPATTTTQSRGAGLIKLLTPSVYQGRPQIMTPEGEEELPISPAGEEPAPSTSGFIRLNQDELNQIAAAQAKLAAGETCPGAVKSFYSVKVYKVSTKQGDIFVEALNEDSAKDKAEDAGYNVQTLRRWYEWEGDPVVTKPATTPQQISEVSLSGQKLKDFVATLYDQGNQYLINAWESGENTEQKVNNYNEAVGRYNSVVNLVKNWVGYSRDALIDMLNATDTESAKSSGLIRYLSGAFAEEYATVMRPKGISDAEYEMLKPYIKPYGFDSEAFYADHRGDNPALASADRYIMASIGD